jgi:hypothetical protein
MRLQLRPAELSLMKLTALALRFRWLQMPAGLLVLLLQRTPILRVATQFEGVLSENAPAILRSGFTAVALGAFHSLAGATVFNVTATPTAATPASGAANSSFSVPGTTGTAMSIGFTVTGAPASPRSWRVTGTLPTGLSVTGGNPVNVTAPYKMTVAGTPTAAGSFPVTVTAYDTTGGAGGNNAKITVNFSITGGVSNTAPTITTQPLSQTVLAGSAVTFTVAANGTPAPSYQWKKAGIDISGATTATLALNNVQLADAATYTAVATNSAGSATSNGATLTVNTLPVITTQPLSQTAVVGSTVTFAAAASGTPAPNFQWKKSGADISGASTATLTLTNIQLADAATYTVVATNSAGSATSNGAALTVNAPPAITTQPLSQTAVVGASVTFVVAASGTPAPTYQWKKGGVDISGATSATLALSNLQLTDAATYTVSATNSVSVATSNSAVLTVNSAPAFTTQPQSQTVTAGATVTFTAAASGTPSPAFQWRKDGADIAGATSATLTLNNVQLADGATYTVVATNTVSSLTSVGAILTVNPALTAPVITTQPQAQTAVVGSFATFGAAASGTPAPTYQWRKNGTDIAGATGPTLTLNSIQFSDAADYSVVALNSVASVASNTAALTVHAPPSFTAQPQSQSVVAGTPVTFASAASGTPAPTYQWKKGGADISGATGATLTLNAAQLGDAGIYTVVATNAVTSVTSNGATLSVSAAPVAPAITAQPQSQTAVAGSSVIFSVAATGTPTPTYQWKKGLLDIAGAISPTLTLGNVQLSDAATYSVAVSNSVASVTSASATLTVNVPPTFTVQPASQTVLAGAAVTLTSAATGVPTPTFQWKRDGAEIVGATSSALTLNNVQLADAATYTVVATNAASSVTSASAVLSVNVPPTITTQPLSQTVFVGANVTLTSAASGTPAPAFQWKKDGGSLLGATGPSLTLNNVQTGDSGAYVLVATNAAGSATSATATLAVNPVPPTIATQPQSHTVAVGSAVVFSVEATGNALTYQWKKDGAPILAATASRLFLAGTQSRDIGNYTVTVGNAGGGFASSNAAALSVVTTSNPGRVVNWSVRGTSGAGNKVLIMGFVTGGDGTSGNTNLLVRGAGPSIIPAPYYVTDALTDPAISVIPAGSSTPFTGNDNWGGTAALKTAAQTTGAFPFVSDASKDAAVVGDFPRNVYSVVVSGNNGATGSTLAEIYDGDPAVFNAALPRLVNVSARAFVGGTDTLTAGFVISGETAKTMLIRGIGPDSSFAARVGYANLADPSIAVYHAHDGISTLVLVNDDWGGDPQLTIVGDSLGAAPLGSATSKDSVLLLTLDPGVYSAQVIGVNGSAGITLIEVYVVP